MIKSNQINAFVNKAINVEYVFLILTGIIKIMTVQINKFAEDENSGKGASYPLNFNSKNMNSKPIDFNCSQTNET